MLRSAAAFRRASLALSAVAALAPAASRADSIRAVQGFQSTASGSSTTGNRSFVQTGFVGASTTMTAADLATFQDGSLSYTDGSTTHNYAWNDVIPSDLGGGSVYPQNPDRGDTATPFPGEGSGGGTLKDVFTSMNLAYLLDGEADVAWSLELRYAAGQGVVADGDDQTMELFLLERGANSMLGVQALLYGGGVSDAVILNFRTGTGSEYGVARMGGLTDFSLNSLEIDGAQQVAGIGLDLGAFRLTAGQAVVGYRFFVEKDAASLHYDGPDFLGFVGSVPTQAVVPEPASLALATMGAVGVALASLRRRVS